MILTVNDVYRIATKMLTDADVLRIQSDVLKDRTLTEVAVFFLQNGGKNGFNDLFEEVNMGDELHLCEKNGRIYCYIVDMWDMYTSKTFPITDEILKRFPLKHDGELFVKKYMQ